MREIKFRGLKKDGKFAYGYLLSESAIGTWGNSQHYTYAEVDKNTVGQYTGLKDIKGNEIFEGDIVNYALDYDIDRYGQKNIKVDWNKLSCCFYPLISKLPNELIIIGNIHQNPELLESEATHA